MKIFSILSFKNKRLAFSAQVDQKQYTKVCLPSDFRCGNADRSEETPFVFNVES